MNSLRTNGEQKKPPISITELNNKDKGSGHEQGSLSYVEPNHRPGNPGTKPKMNLTQLVIAVGLSVLLFFVISNFMLASKKDAQTLLSNQKVLETQQTATQSGLATQTSRIENIISSQATQDTKIASLESTWSTILGRLTGAESSIVSLDTRMDTLWGNVTVLENLIAEGVGGGVVDYYIADGKLWVSPSRTGYYRLQFTLVPKSSSGFIVNTTAHGTLEYYTKSYSLYEDVWISKPLPSVIGPYLKGYDLYVEVLVGTSEPDEEDEPEGWE